MLDAKADVLCNLEPSGTKTTDTKENCLLYVRQTIEAGAIGFFTVQYDANIDIAIQTTRAEEMSIESNEIKLTYLPDFDGDGVYF